MCGIAGVYDFGRRKGDGHFLPWCLSTMRHRGPNGTGIWDNGFNYTTVFARLAIRDLSERGDQPMLSECGNFCISFNGEIYNTEALRLSLQPYKTGFRSSSDTEVLLYALIHLGIAATLDAADGMFAFAFYSLNENKLVLARDRAGIKPLYIGVADEGIVYSSQYDHIINHPWLRRESLDTSAIANFLLLGYVPEGEGAVFKTQMLPHGHYLTVENQQVHLQEYYVYGAATRSTSSTPLENVLQQSVRSELVSDVPVGTFMSGGVDSTLISYFANQQTHLQTFTIGVKDDASDESDAAEQFARIFRTTHSTRYISSTDLLSLFDQNTRAFSEPFSDFSSLPSLYLAAFAKERITVALSGDGGDELFWGYPRNRKALQHIKYYWRGRTGRRWRLILNKATNFATDISKHWHQEDFVSYYYSMLGVSGASYWLPKVFKEGSAMPFFQRKAQQLLQGCKTSTDLMNLARKMEVDLHLQRVLLKVDRASMYHSLEVRVPLLSNALMQESIEYNYKDCIQADQGKWNLKQLLIEKSNKSLVLQPKKGFVIPMDQWIRKEAHKAIKERVLDMPKPLAVLFDRKGVELLLKCHMDGIHNQGWFIWSLFALSSWHSEHFKKYTGCA